MSKISNFGGNTELEMRIEKIERSHSSLEARLISLTTLIRSRYGNNETTQDRDISQLNLRISQIESEKDGPTKRISDLEKRIRKLEENLPVVDFQKSLEKTNDKIRVCMSELRESIKVKEEEFRERILGEFNSFKQKIDIRSKIREIPTQEKKSDEIENIIRELQSRLDRKSVTPTKNRSVSFSILKSSPLNSSSSKRKIKKKQASRRVIKVKQLN